ncbi:hypothetical protein [Azospirillum sp. TSH100]|uniref:hypothetical protein n=1 Tax=Azospirillum sp. TSH100 TaxID=652764 RepID=UPI0010A9E3F2|nr:hypothetical protein [Azospirillum sp. TSH100]QCG89064.1 hypothetical protein E6C72_14680 [Azospirillum sp. TSH100]
MLTARALGESLRARKSIPHLSDVEFTVFSQTGEDGIIEWLIQNLPIRSESFIEFGVQDYTESNTRYLMRNRNWRGFVLDANVTHIETIRNDDIYWRHDLVAMSAFITKENVNELLSRNGGGGGGGGEVGLLSIDIDGNDYWVFDAIDVVRPDIVICEYNAVLGDLHALTIPYDCAFQRSIAHPSWLYFGASIRALEQAAARKGYVLVGSNGAGHNAFFVRAELASHLSIADRSARPSLFRESRAEDGSLSHVGGVERAALIADMPVLDLETGRTAPLAGHGQLYSRDWQTRMGGRRG